MENLGTKLAWIFCGAFIIAGILGFVPNPILGPEGLFVTNTPHNLVHIVTGLAFAFVAKAGNSASIAFMRVFGVVYLLTGLIGFAATGMNSEGYLLGLVRLNTLDNFLHLGLGFAVLTAGILAATAFRTRTA